ncbi:serine/threonine protein kinase [Myxococcota bacterium]|nr:serine/threonine protein kinase [Myxococcota bacterium]
MAGPVEEGERGVAPGERFGRYTLYGKLAAGGMASVYLGRDESGIGLSRWVAIKRVHPHLVERPDVVQMFLNEAKILARLEHPNISSIVDFGTEDGLPYIVMRYLHGAALSGALRRLVDAKAELPIDFMAHVAAEVCDGLHYAHEALGEDGKPLGLVHRDISPQNIFITFDGRVALLDFGVAKAAGYAGFTRTGHIKGKYAYMSPEQVEAQPLDRRSDVFSLGIVLWESLAGRHLFRRKQHIDTLRAIASADAPLVTKVNAAVPAELAAIVSRALAADRKARFQTARAMGTELRAYLARTGGVGPERVAEVMRVLFPDRRHPGDAPMIATETEAKSAQRSQGPVTELGTGDGDAGFADDGGALGTDSSADRLAPELGTDAGAQPELGTDSAAPRLGGRVETQPDATEAISAAELDAARDALAPALDATEAIPSSAIDALLAAGPDTLRPDDDGVPAPAAKVDDVAEPGEQTLNDRTGLLLGTELRGIADERTAVQSPDDAEDATLQLSLVLGRPNTRTGGEVQSRLPELQSVLLEPTAEVAPFAVLRGVTTTNVPPKPEPEARPWDTARAVDAKGASDTARTLDAKSAAEAMRTSARPEPWQLGATTLLPPPDGGASSVQVRVVDDTEPARISRRAAVIAIGLGLLAGVLVALVVATRSRSTTTGDAPSGEVRATTRPEPRAVEPEPPEGDDPAPREPAP